MQFSYEIYPPKTEPGYTTLFAKLAEMQQYPVDFISVTCGAGGGSNINNMRLCAFITQELKMQCLPHITAIGRSKADIRKLIGEYEKIKLHQYLILRGDMPANEQQIVSDFDYASDLGEFIRIPQSKQKFFVAGYPEGHTQASDIATDFQHQINKAKQFNADIVTQLFFDNDIFLRYAEKLATNGFSGKLRAGIFPITNYAQIKKIATLSASHLPTKLIDNLEAYKDQPQQLLQFGTQYAIEQINDLSRHGHDYFHMYTMNQSNHINAIRQALTQTL